MFVFPFFFSFPAIKALNHLHSIRYQLRASMGVALSVWNIFRECASRDVDLNLKLLLRNSISTINFFSPILHGHVKKKISLFYPSVSYEYLPEWKLFTGSQSVTVFVNSPPSIHHPQSEQQPKQLHPRDSKTEQLPARRQRPTGGAVAAKLRFNPQQISFSSQQTRAG